MAKRVLIVDDEPQISGIVEEYLKRDGFSTEVAPTVALANEAIERAQPDLMILDINLPDGTGLDVLRKMAAHRRVPTILLTARADEVDRIVGLELGADDYVTKPFSPGELVARVRALLRRVSEVAPTSNGDVIKVRDLEIDAGRHEVRINGTVASLTPSEFNILSVLASSPEQVFTRAQLLDNLGDDGAIFERTLDRHVNNLRKKIEPNPQEPQYVVTVYGVGYKMHR
jgi:DNA-binding response OmpR family regulator